MVSAATAMNFIYLRCISFTQSLHILIKGVLIARWIGQELGVETPFIDEVIEWAGKIRGEKFLKDGKVDLEYCLSGSQTTGIPPAYGIMSVMDILD
jgi:hypothetical protein